MGATMVLRAGNFFANVKKAKESTESLRKKLGGATKGLGTFSTATKTAGSRASSLTKNLLGTVAAYASLSSVKDFAIDCVTGVMELERANERLSTLMLNTKGNTQQMVEGIIAYGDELERITTIEGDATVAGASQLATFQLQADNIKALLPALQNLAVGQYGVNVSQDNMIASANLLGKVMMGQTGALSKAGVSFTDAQAKILKTGTETEKAAALIEVLNQNFGGLAETMAQTDEGKIIQLRNAWGSVKDEVGFALMPVIQGFVGYVHENIPQMRDIVSGSISWFQENIEGIKVALIGVIGTIATYKTVMGTLTLITNLQTIAEKALTIQVGIGNGVKKAWFAISNTEMGIRIGLLALKAKETISAKAHIVALGAQTIATKIAAGAQTLLNTAFLASPVGWIVVGVLALIAVFVLLWKKFEGFRNFWKATWEVIKVVFSTVWNGIKIVFSAVWEHIKIVFSTAVNHIKGIFNFWMAVFKGDWNGAWEAVKGIVSNIWEGIKGVFINAFNALNELTGGKLTGIGEKIKGIFGGIKSFIGGVWNGITNGAKTMVNGVIKVLNTLIRGANKLQYDIPEWVPGIGGKKFGLNIPEIPMLANGGIIRRPGSVLVGERGPEILNLNRGASVVPLDRAGTATTTNHNTFYFTIHAGGLNDDVINEFVGKVKFALANM